MNIQLHLYNQILHSFHYVNQEIGGLLLIKNKEIVGFIVDQDGHSALRSYHPSVRLAHIIEKSIEAGYEIAFIHCHPETGLRNTSLLSGGDEQFAQSFMQLNKWNTLDMAVVSCNKINYYRCYSGNTCHRIELIVPDLFDE